MSFAKKLKQVVAANFIEIATSDDRAAATAARPEGEAAAAEPLDRVYAAAPPEPEHLAAGPAAATDHAGNGLSPYAHEDGGAAASLAEDAPVTPAEEAEPDEEPAPPLGDMVGEEGDVDFERVYAHYELPASRFTAEQALTMLSTMPRDLSLRVKRLTVKATLDAIGGTIGATPETISEDARAKRALLERYIADLDEETVEVRARISERIQDLERQVEALKQDAMGATRKRNAAEEFCRAKAETLDQIIAFFEADAHSEEGVDPSASTPVAEVDELPPFMREDAVLRLLGITPDDEAAMGVGGEAAAAAQSGRKGGIRRRTMIRRAY